jgi:hypothetical protein
MAEVLYGPLDLFGLAGISVTKEALYNAAVGLDADTRPAPYAGGMYFAVRTVDKDSRTKHWDVYVFYAPGDGAVHLHHWFKQGDPKMPKAAGAVAIKVNPRTSIVNVVITEDLVDGGFWPAQVYGLSPWERS